MSRSRAMLGGAGRVGAPEAPADALRLVGNGAGCFEAGVTAYSDEVLVRSFLDGDAAAFDTLLGRYRSRVYGICYRFTNDREDAEDLVQDVFLRVVRGLSGFRAESRFSTWLYRVAVNTCLNWSDGRKRAGVELRHDLVDPAPDAADRLSREQSSGALRRAIAALPERQRLVVSMRVYEELSHREIASILECPVGTVKANFFFGLKNLRRAMTMSGSSNDTSSAWKRP